MRVTGSLVISLDLELYWGMGDVVPLARYQNTLLAARAMVPRILELFERYELHATWATVGLVLYDRRSDALRDAPSRWPTYHDATLSNRERLSCVGEDEATDPYHFGRSLVRMITAVPHQEIGTHTFSHYYCIEPGQDVEAFTADIEAARRAAAALGMRIESIVFPRHQIASEYLPVCTRLGVTTYRGNVPLRPYAARPKESQTLLFRLVRAADTYVNITGHHTFSVSEILEGPLENVRASHYLRSYNRRLRLFEPLKLARVLSSMTYAARRGRVYHLWMHPEDLGVHPEENIRLLERMAEHFERLREAYGMRSLTMAEQGAAARAAAEG